MQFEHLVQVNELSDSSILKLSRKQLWQGLLGRARQPDLFLEALEGFSLLEDTGAYIRRELNFPNLIVNDEVWLVDLQEIRITITPTEQVAGGDLSIKIEEPEPEALFVRFSYTTPPAPGATDNGEYDQYIQQAYMQTDIGTVRMIRESVIAGLETQHH